jgi:hypothetical protein
MTSFRAFLASRWRTFLVPLFFILFALWISVTAAEVGFVIDVLAPS